MKLAKAMKKLKFWSRKKKKSKYYYIKDHAPPPPPPTFHYYCPPWVTVQPSAPPLPAWFDQEDQQYSHFGQGSWVASSSEAEFSNTKEEIATDANPVYLPQTSAVSDDTSYQQCMVPYPVCGVPAVRREKAGGFFGCGVSIGRLLIRCFFPCFHIRE